MRYVGLRLGICSILLLLVSVLHAADISVSQTSPPGRLVRASTTAEGTGYAWFVSGLTVLPDGNVIQGFVETQPYNDSKSIVFTGPPGRYAIMLVVATEGGGLDQGQALTVIGSPEPIPPTPPGPDPVPPEPPPTPDLPEDEFDNVGQTSYKLASAINAEGRSKAIALSKLYRDTADKLEDTTYPDITSAAKALQKERDTIWGDKAQDWAGWYGTVSNSWNKFWPMDKGKVIKFYRIIGDSLEAVQSRSLGSDAGGSSDYPFPVPIMVPKRPHFVVPSGLEEIDERYRGDYSSY